MPIFNFDYKDVLSKILICPTDNRTKSAITFWKKETGFFKKLYKKYPDDGFWRNISLIDTPCTKGKIPSLVLFFDKKNLLWSKILHKKWKTFHWSPPQHKSYKFHKDTDKPIKHKPKKRNLRDFLS